MVEPEFRPDFIERLLRRLLPALSRSLDELRARVERQHDEQQADRGHDEQGRRQLRESLIALEAQFAADRKASRQQLRDRVAGLESQMAAAQEENRGLLRESLAALQAQQATAREESRHRAEGLAAALHDAHQRQAELQLRLDALAADGEQRSATAAAALDELRRAQFESLTALRDDMTARLLAQADAAAADARQQDAQWTLWREAAETRAEALAAELAAEHAETARTVAHLQASLADRLQSAAAETHAAHLAELERLGAADEARAAVLDARLRLIESPAAGLDYAAFEARFRGSEEIIRQRQMMYLPQLQGHAPIADLGCGRGELVAVLRDAGLEVVGVESNEGQLAACRAKSLPVEGADLFDWLDSRPQESLGAITCLQVIEHLSLREQRRLLALALGKLKAGGMLLFETVNPHCPEALEWFYIDPTHQRPVYPEMLEFLMEQAGFKAMAVRFQIPCSSAPPEQPLTAVTGADFALWGFKP